MDPRVMRDKLFPQNLLSFGAEPGGASNQGGKNPGSTAAVACMGGRFHALVLPHGTVALCTSTRNVFLARASPASTPLCARNERDRGRKREGGREGEGERKRDKTYHKQRPASPTTTKQYRAYRHAAHKFCSTSSYPTPRLPTFHRAHPKGVPRS